MLLQLLNAWIAAAIQGLLRDDVDAYLTGSVQNPNKQNHRRHLALSLKQIHKQIFKKRLPLWFNAKNSDQHWR